MLQSLYIKNFALIDEVFIEFEPGLNIILGETGAGKSILIDALMTTLGERTSPEMVKSGENKAIVEAIFQLDNPKVLQEILKEFDEDISNTLILRREITAKGQSRCFINDTPFPLNQVKEIGTYLIDFHGQHSHQQLLSPKFQLDLIDSLSNNDELIEQYIQLKKLLENKIEELKSLESDFLKYSKEKDTSEFELNEILRINPQPNELQNIEKELKKLENIELLNNGLTEIYEKIYESESSVIDLLSFTAKKLNTLIRYDESLEHILRELEVIIHQISEISKEISNKFNKLSLDPDYIENLRHRLSDLRYLEKKYINYENIFTEKARLESIIKNTNNIEKFIEEKSSEIKNLKKQITQITKEIHNNRLNGIEILETKIPEILDELGMKNVRFKVEIYQEETKENNVEDLSVELDTKYYKLLPKGLDKVEFLISTNPNTKPMPLENIASGGELSRLMLALKSTTAEYHKFPTMIFDEIDTGISGKIASRTAQLMKKLGKNHQVIAITHLPQIASAGSNIILIEKKEQSGNIKVKATELNYEQKIFEIARLLSGESITEFALENARRLVEETKEL